MYKNRIDIVHTGLSIHNSSNTRLLLYGTEKTEHRATTTTKSSKNEKMEKNVKNIKKKNKNEKKKYLSLGLWCCYYGAQAACFYTTYGIFRSDIRLCCVCGNFSTTFLYYFFIYNFFCFLCYAFACVHCSVCAC